MADSPEEVDAATRWLQAADRRLLAEVTSALDSAIRTAGTWLACGFGCSECCVGPFPISTLDARRLQLGLATMRQAEPRRAEALLRRAESASRSLSAGFPGDPRGWLRDDSRSVEQFLSQHSWLPCPVLKPDNQGCELYDSRPMSCRTFGPPVRVGVEDLAPCHRCFQGAPEAQIERCRVEPDPAGLEDAILVRLERAERLRGETLVAFALAAASPTGSA